MKRVMGMGTAAVVVIVLATMPFVGVSSFWITFGLQLLIWVILAVSWNLFSGFGGYPSFGHGVFYGAGIYTTAVLVARFNLPILLPIALSGIVAAGIAFVVGLAIFTSPRFRGDIFGLVTLALTFVVATVVANTPAIDGGSGVFARGGEGDLLGGGPDGLYLLALIIAVVTVAAAWGIARSRWGRALAAIRDDEHVAEGLGVPTYWYKVATFSLSAGLAGLAGAPQALFLGYVEVGTTFALSVPLFVIMMAILGGMTTWYGPVIGAVAVTVLQQYLIGQGRAEVNQIILGVVLVVLILIWPQGIGGEIQRRTAARNLP
ncbi:branched-chain amino acid ABC transporter permease [soil metagenome]